MDGIKWDSKWKKPLTPVQRRSYFKDKDDHLICLKFKAAPQSYIWPGDTYGLGHMVTGHLKTSEKEERKQKEERLLSLKAFILNPKNLDVLNNTF